MKNKGLVSLWGTGRDDISMKFATRDFRPSSQKYICSNDYYEDFDILPWYKKSTYKKNKDESSIGAVKVCVIDV